MPEQILFKEYMNILDSLWPIMEPLLIKYSDPRFGVNEAWYFRKPGGGRKPNNLRPYLNTVIYVLVTGTTWLSVYKNSDGTLCNGKLAHKWHMRWANNEFYTAFNILILTVYDVVYGLQLDWTSIDCSLYKAPFAVECVGKNPTDKGKHGKKRSVWTDKTGLPIGLLHAPANTHDSMLLRGTLSSAMIQRIYTEFEKHLCLDKGYAGQNCENTIKEFNFTGHVQSRGDEKKQLESDDTFEAKRWVVERTHNWFNKFKKLNPSYEKTDISHSQLSFLASSLITARTIFRSKEGISPWKNSKPVHEDYMRVGEMLKIKAPQ